MENYQYEYPYHHHDIHDYGFLNRSISHNDEIVL